MRDETGKKLDVVPKEGERALIAGMTGSGKTSLGIWLLQQLPVPPVIYDTKIEPKFLLMDKAILVHSPEELHDRYHDNIIVNEEDGSEENIAEYFVVQPTTDELRDPEFMDDRWLNYHYEHLHGVPAYVDEIFQWHKNSRPGNGLTNMLTRGRSKGVTTIMSTQRPRHISLFCLSEADRYFMMRLLLDDDRKRMAEVMRGVDYREDTAKHYFRYFDHNIEREILCSPIKLAESLNTGYTDHHGPVKINERGTENAAAPPAGDEHEIIFI